MRNRNNTRTIMSRSGRINTNSSKRSSRKLKWHGHVIRSSGLFKTILQGTVQGGRRRGRQRKRWEDNVKEWTGLEWNIILRKAENREDWRKLVVKSTVVP